MSGSMGSNSGSDHRSGTRVNSWAPQTPEDAADEAREIQERMELEPETGEEARDGLLPPSVCMRVVLGIAIGVQCVVFATSLGLTWADARTVATHWMWVGGVTTTSFQARVR
eukprot:Hpha_TRINITY_DN26850_c0_g1::TRINITY_DN26850_c0_g1_i1::g.17352::m.17352